MAADMHNPVHVYFGVRSQEDSYDLERLRRLAQEHGNMTLHVVVATGPVHAGLRSGLVTDAIQQDLPALKNFVGYFCGAPAMVEALSSLAQSLGMPLDNIHADAFYPSGI
jgi:ferredoxin-NAD(P)+ reductase (naphthalene dioxygenase ferredoxin-specific)